MSKLDSETKQKEAEEANLVKEQAAKDKLEEDTNFQNILKADEAKESEKGYDDLTNSELLDVVADALNKTMDARMQSNNAGLAEQMKKIVESGDATKKAVLSIIAKTNVDRVINDNADFGDFKDETKLVMQKYPGIDIQDAYTLAKAKKVSELPPKKELETERPDVTMSPLNTSRFENRENKSHDTEKGNEYSSSGQHGLVGFRAFADKGVEKVLAARNIIE